MCFVPPRLRSLLRLRHTGALRSVSLRLRTQTTPCQRPPTARWSSGWRHDRKERRCSRWRWRFARERSRRRRWGRSDLTGRTDSASQNAFQQPVFFFSGGFSPCCQTHFHPPAFVFSHILFCAEEKLTGNISQRFGGKNLKPQIIFLPLWFLHICCVCTFSSPASFPHVFVPPPEAAMSRAGKTCRV